MINAVVLAGRANTGKLKDCSDAPCEALIEIGGKPLVKYVVEALLATGRIDRVVVVGPRKHLAAVLESEKVDVCESGDTIIDNVRRGIHRLPPDGLLLITSSDIPLVAADMINDFLERCNESEGDFFYPIVEKEVTERQYPLTKRTYVSLRDGTFTGGNFFLIKYETVEGALGLAEELFAARKSPVQMARILGVRFLLGLIFKTLTITDLEKKISGMVGSRGKAVVTPFPEIGIDVDKPEDLVLARSVLM